RLKSRVGPFERKPDVKSRPPGHRVELDRAAESLGDDPACRVETEPGALADVLGGEERVENPIADLVRDPGAVVDDVDSRTVPVACGGDRYLARVAERFDRVCEQVRPDLV